MPDTTTDVLNALVTAVFWSTSAAVATAPSSGQSGVTAWLVLATPSLPPSAPFARIPARNGAVGRRPVRPRPFWWRSASRCGVPRPPPGREGEGAAGPVTRTGGGRRRRHRPDPGDRRRRRPRSLRW